MSFQCKIGVWFTLFVLVVAAVSSQLHVEATRVLPGDFAKGESDDISMYPLYKTVQDNMAFWLQRLASGPSGGGGGN